MNIKDIRELNVEEINKKTIEFKTKLLNYRLQLSNNSLKNNQVVGHCRKQIAKLKTVLTEKRRNGVN